jgi:hypothetical protein
MPLGPVAKRLEGLKGRPARVVVVARTSRISFFAPSARRHQKRATARRRYESNTTAPGTACSCHATATKATTFLRAIFFAGSVVSARRVRVPTLWFKGGSESVGPILRPQTDRTSNHPTFAPDSCKKKHGHSLDPAGVADRIFREIEGFEKRVLVTDRRPAKPPRISNLRTAKFLIGRELSLAFDALNVAALVLRLSSRHSACCRTPHQS